VRPRRCRCGPGSSPLQGTGVVEEPVGQLGCGGVEDPDVVLGTVRSCVAGPQHAGKDFPGSQTCAVIDAGDKGDEAVAALVVASDVSLLEYEVTSVASISETSGSAATADGAGSGLRRRSRPGCAVPG
jgi:hypothetical protein